MMNPLQYVRDNPYTTAAGVLVPAALYGANALVSGGDERWDRTAINTGGNLAGGLGGAAAGYRVGGIPGAVVGGLAGAAGGGYLSDAIANQFDDTDGKAIALLNAHLSEPQNAYEKEAMLRQQPQNAYEKEAMLRQQLQQAQMMQREQQRAMREQAMQQYQ